MEKTIEHQITVYVNDKPVIFDSRQPTGLQIKTKAGVPTDSILYELRGNERIPIGDSETINLHENERFLDVPGGNVS